MKLIGITSVDLEHPEEPYEPAWRVGALGMGTFSDSVSTINAAAHWHILIHPVGLGSNPERFHLADSSLEATMIVEGPS